jgi:hypothetical protein
LINRNETFFVASGEGGLPADCDRELSSAAGDIVDNQTSWHIALVADDLAALVRSRAD